MPKILNNVREDILKVARDTLINSGYSKISMREIAVKCGIGTGTMYNYFKSKQEIITCILNSDWATMIRRMENSNKTNHESINKLEFIFTELSFFMNHTHNIWNENLFDELDVTQLCKAKERREVSSIQLSNIVLEAINKNICYEKDDFLSDLLTGLFLSFANKSDIEFEKLKPYIIKLLN